MIDFIAKNWVNIGLVIVGTFALVIYKLQERRKKIDAASLIILQIDELQERLLEISGYIVDGQLNNTAFYESLPLIETDYWNKYKHYFVREIDANSYNSLNQFYNYISEVQEQQALMKALLKNHFYMTQSLIGNIEGQFISMGINQSSNGSIPGTNPQSLVFDANMFWDIYNRQRIRLESIINQKPLTSYIPDQIRITLENMIKKYSMLTIIGSDGYQLLKKWSAKRF